MRLAVVTSRYASPRDPYARAFVHTRNRMYVRHGATVQVFVPTPRPYTYTFEGIPVAGLPAADIVRRLDAFDAVLIHLLHPSHRAAQDGRRVYDGLLRSGQPTLFFIHGIEVQRVTRVRRAQLSLRRPRSLAIAGYHDFFQIPVLKHYLRRFFDEHPAARFVTVSRWMLDEIHRNLHLNLQPKAHVIPNGIHTRRFVFRDRWPQRHRLLAIRPLIWGGKYAVDLAVKTMHWLPTPFTLSLYGRGPDAARVRRWLQRHGLSQRVRVVARFFEHAELPGIHAAHGIYYAVTRMDAQGVSMCEAMASGMPVVSFRVAGIPEFVHHGRTGLLVTPYRVEDAARAIQRLAEDRAFYTYLAEGARRLAEAIDLQRTTQYELRLVRSLSARAPLPPPMWPPPFAASPDSSQEPEGG